MERTTRGNQVEEVCSPSRRRLLCHGLCGAAALLLPVSAQSGTLQGMEGEVRINGQRARAGSPVRARDTITTGPQSTTILVMGRDAFLVRANSNLEMQGKPGSGLANGLRLLTGALLGVFSPGAKRLQTATATIGIRGTGIYLEADPSQTYLCACYGAVEIEDTHGAERRLLVSGYHTPTMIFAEMTDGAMMKKAEFKNHADAELVMLEKLVGRVPKFGGR